MANFCAPLLAFALLGLTQCHWALPAPTPVSNQLDLLPPPTQTGQRTFGCLVNGQAWTEFGNPFAGIVFLTQYDYSRLVISCPRAFSDNKGIIQVDQTIVFNVDSITAPGVYSISGRHSSTLRFSDYLTRCTWDASIASPATLTITKLDFVNRIVSGTFSFTLETPGCGKVTATNGRFDSRF